MLGLSASQTPFEADGPRLRTRQLQARGVQRRPRRAYAPGGAIGPWIDRQILSARVGTYPRSMERIGKRSLAATANTTSNMAYPDKDLELMGFAVNYHNWIFDELEPYLGDAVAEVGGLHREHLEPSLSKTHQAPVCLRAVAKHVSVLELSCDEKNGENGQ